ncbi:major capsid protein [Calidithermus timidus]|uniref:major capsid protein n=1 Tax=Calidithermus timidus TaxID=307124 RepID=UPI0003A95EC9|nr:major capsid protein [Calidithermus timidus]
MFNRLRLLALFSLGASLALAETSGGFDPGTVASSVNSYITSIVAAGAGVLALTIGISAAWRYAKKFLKG